MPARSHRWSPQGEGLLLLLAAQLVLAVSVRQTWACNITDGHMDPSCRTVRSRPGQHLIIATVPLDLRVQWEHGNGYCGELSVQMIAAHHGVWVGQQHVRDLCGGEVLLDDKGSLEAVLETLGFAHTTWFKSPAQVAAHHQPGNEDFSSHAAAFLLWMKQQIAQGWVPIFGAKVLGDSDTEYDHIMPAYAVHTWQQGSNSTAEGSTAEDTHTSGPEAAAGTASLVANRPRRAGMLAQRRAAAAHAIASSSSSSHRSPVLEALPALSAYSGSDTLVWNTNYGQVIRRSMQDSYGTRATCKRPEEGGGCISTDDRSYGVAVGGLKQPGAAAAAAAGAAMGSGAVAAGAANTSLAGPQTTTAAALFRPLHLTVTAWSVPGTAAQAEPLTSLKALMTGYRLDTSSCAPVGQPFTVYRFDGISAFRSTGKTDASSNKPVLANPASLQELSERCQQAGKACKRAQFVQADGLSLGHAEFGPVPSNAVVYFVCVAGAAA